MRFLLLLAVAAVACSSGPLVIDSFEVDEANPDVGAPVTFSFAVRGASKVRIDPAPGVVGGSPVTVVPATSATFTLTATNEYGRAATRSIDITLRPLLAVTAADAIPGLVLPDKEVTLTWTTTSAERATITDASTGQVSDVGVNGSMAVHPSATTIYTLTAYNRSDRRPASVTAKIAARVGVPPSLTSFSVDKPSIVQGDEATLSWSGNAINYSISDGTTTFDVGPRRSLTVRPAVTTTYTLLAVGPGGTTTSAPITVTVDPHPATTLTYTPPATGSLQLVADPCNPCSAVTLRIMATASLQLRGLALNLPLDSTKVSLDGFAAGAALSSAVSKAIMGTGPLQDVLVVGLALPGSGAAPAQDVTVNAGDELASFRFGLLSAGGRGAVFDGAAPRPGYKASVQTASGRIPGAIAVGKLEAN
jgi:hypothetical protein